MATRVDLSHFSLARLNQQTRKHPTEIAYIILSPLQAVLWPILCLNLSFFVTVSTRVGLAKDWMTMFNQPTPKTHYMVQKCGAIWVNLWHIWCYNFQVVVAIATGARLTQISHTVKLKRQKRVVWCKKCGSILFTSSFIANFPLKFTGGRCAETWMTV